MNDSTAGGASSYPVTYSVEPQMTGRNRVTVLFRLILAIPHLLLVGGPGFSISIPTQIFGRSGGNSLFSIGGNGVVGVVAGVCAIISWFAIVFTGKQPRGLWDFMNFYLQWRSKAISYMALLRDEYPPLGEGSYSSSLSVGRFPETRDRLSVGLRIFYLIPQVIVLFFVSIAWAVSVFICWLVIVFTGSCPEGLYKFGEGYLRWSLRVEAYALLMRDEYPPFSLD